MIAVKIYWNVEADGTPVPEETNIVNRPVSYYGPFEDISQAISWVDNDYPDDDPERYDVDIDDFHIPADAGYLSHPSSIFGDVPDEDIRDYLEGPPS